MTNSAPSPTTREQLRAALTAAGLVATEDRLDALLPGYENQLAGAARLRALDLAETEPSVVFSLPQPR